MTATVKNSSELCRGRAPSADTPAATDRPETKIRPKWGIEISTIAATIAIDDPQERAEVK